MHSNIVAPCISFEVQCPVYRLWRLMKTFEDSETTMKVLIFVTTIAILLLLSGAIPTVALLLLARVENLSNLVYELGLLVCGMQIPYSQ